MHLCVALIRIYQSIIGCFKPCCCRFTPTCSEYAAQAFLLHGPLKGAILTLKRILKCHPWGKAGFDPVPAVCQKGRKHGKTH